MSSNRITPSCLHNLFMKMFVSKSNANPWRKYWKCKYWGKEEDCEIFHWDDGVFGQREREKSQNEGEMIHLLRNFEKEFGKEIVSQLCSKELEEMKKFFKSIRKKMNIVIVL